MRAPARRPRPYLIAIGGSAASLGGSAGAFAADGSTIQVTGAALGSATEVTYASHELWSAPGYYEGGQAMSSVGTFLKTLDSWS